MHFKQFYVGCLAHASYLIGDGGEAVVVDPARDVQMYLDEAEAHGLTIRCVLETHLHADFVSGHRELADRVGATIALGARAEAGFPHRSLGEGDEITVGEVVIRAIETPGHTPESLSFLIFENARDPKPWGVLTGDTLFVGDVGRVDILSSRLPVTDLAGLMFDSLGKLMRLPDETRVYPAHGAGSLCGRSMSKDSSSTIGRERMMNPALKPMSREAFVADITRDVPETPVYFLHSRDTNRSGPAILADRPMPPALAPGDFAERMSRGAIVVDTRPAAAFGDAHVPGSLHVSLDGQYASWVGTMVRPEQEILIVADADRVDEAVTRLTRVGYENVVGILDGGVDRWRREGRATTSTRHEPVETAFKSERKVLDVRRAPEWQAFHFEGAIHIPLAQLEARIDDLDREAEWVVVCASGYRSGIAASVLERAGFGRVVNAVGGMDAYRKAGLPVESRG
jgi:glyoxylase-like metal-dependent hydrolase (beta-lactamase superfamily II)/rhodanese-related sulfurtransferase